MKSKFLLAVIFLGLAVSAGAQNLIPDSIAGKAITVSFKGKYHGLIYHLMPDKGKAEAINYVNQLVAEAARENVRDSAGKLVFDTAHVFSVVVSYRMVTEVFYNLGSQQERLTASDNADLKEILIGQLSTAQYYDLLQAIMALNDENHRQTEALRTAGINEIMSINPQ